MKKKLLLVLIAMLLVAGCTKKTSKEETKKIAPDSGETTKKEKQDIKYFDDVKVEDKTFTENHIENNTLESVVTSETEFTSVAVSISFYDKKGNLLDNKNITIDYAESLKTDNLHIEIDESYKDKIDKITIEPFTGMKVG